jgi:hypothetical protein
MCNIGCVATMHHNKSDGKSKRHFWQSRAHDLYLVLQEKMYRPERYVIHYASSWSLKPVRSGYHPAKIRMLLCDLSSRRLRYVPRRNWINTSK